MELNLRYVTDADGTRLAVQIPLNEWEAYHAEHKRLENRLAGQQALKAQANKSPKEGSDDQPSLFSFD